MPSKHLNISFHLQKRNTSSDLKHIAPKYPLYMRAQAMPYMLNMRCQQYENEQNKNKALFKYEYHFDTDFH